MELHNGAQCIKHLNALIGLITWFDFSCGPEFLTDNRSVLLSLFMLKAAPRFHQINLIC